MEKIPEINRKMDIEASKNMNFTEIYNAIINGKNKEIEV